MNRDSVPSRQTVLLLMGSFIFAFLLGELVHDSGHYFCHKIYGNTQVQVHFDPFGGTHIMNGGGFSEKVLGVTSLAGPLSNLLLGTITFLLLWRYRRPILMPLVLWGPVAMIQEGVTFSLGQLTPGGDADWIAVLGIPLLVQLIAGILFLVVGLALIALLLPVFGIRKDDPFGKAFLIILLGMCTLMLIRAIHSFLIAPAYIVENLVPLIFSLLLAVIVAILRKPVQRLVNREEPPELQITWPSVITALCLGAGMFVFQLVLK